MLANKTFLNFRVYIQKQIHQAGQAQQVDRWIRWKGHRKQGNGSARAKILACQGSSHGHCQGGKCVCVCLTSSRERLPSEVIPIAGQIHPPNACNVIPPPDSAHEPLPGEMLADGCPLGNVYGTATSHGRLLESHPARHSVTLRFRLGHLPFLPF